MHLIRLNTFTDNRMHSWYSLYLQNNTKPVLQQYSLLLSMLCFIENGNTFANSKQLNETPVFEFFSVSLFIHSDHIDASCVTVCYPTFIVHIVIFYQQIQLISIYHNYDKIHSMHDANVWKLQLSIEDMKF